MITAKKAEKLSSIPWRIVKTHCNNQSGQLGILEVEREIMTRALDGRCSAKFYMPINDYTKRKLRKNGFRVEKEYYEFNDITEYSVRWG